MLNPYVDNFNYKVSSELVQTYLNMMLEFSKPIPVVVEENKDGYAIYVTDSGMFENDVWCVVLCDGGIVRHYRTDQIKIYRNATFDIEKDKNC